MLKLAKFKGTCKSLFSKSIRTFFGTESHRFFVLSYRFKDDVAQNTYLDNEEQKKHLEQAEKSGKLLFSGVAATSDGTSYMIFNAKDEIGPFDFFKESPIYRGGLISDFKIEEIEMLKQDASKEVMKTFTYR